MTEKGKLKVAHFSFTDDYGAMGAAYELHKVLIKKGFTSTLFVREKTRDDGSIIELGYCDSLEERLFRSINKLYFNENRNNSGTAPVNFDCLGLTWNKELVDSLKTYDLFHIHWVAGLLSIDNVHKLSELGKPVVWTMHDFHPFTGGCHCPESCKKYEMDCSECPALKENYMDITKKLLKEKQDKYSENIQIVTASTWLQEIVNSSRVFRNNPCDIIPIGIDTDCFTPLNKKEMKRKLGLSEDTKVILAGAHSLTQNIKGYVHLERVLEIINNDSYCNELIKKRKLILLTFGYTDEEKKYKSEIQTINMGFIKERRHICEVYNAADVFIFPSVQDTFGMTAVEAMSCGVPTVAFDVSAMRDIIIEGVNGYKAKLNDYSTMATFIIQILKENPIQGKICRQRIVDQYSLECESEKMIQLYDRVSEKIITASNKEEERQINKELEEFIYKCSFEIITDTAPKKCVDMAIGDILMEYSPEFITPERKVRKLLERRIIEQGKQVYIYGAGAFGIRTLDELEKYGIPVQGFLDLDEKKVGKFIKRYPIWKLVKKDDSMEHLIIVAGMHYTDMIKCLMNLGYLYCHDFF